MFPVSFHRKLKKCWKRHKAKLSQINNNEWHDWRAAAGPSTGTDSPSISRLLGCWPSVSAFGSWASRCFCRLKGEVKNAEGLFGLVVDVVAGLGRRGVPMRSRRVRSGRSDVEETLPQSGKYRKVPREMGVLEFQNGNGNYAKHKAH